MLNNKIKLRSQKWFNNPDNQEMTALYLERYLNYGLTRQELQSGKPIIGIAQTGSDLSPCNRHHIELTKRVRDGVIAAGGTGLISVIANAFPHEITSVVNFALEDKYNEARIIHYQLLNLIGLTFANGNPGGVKAMLSKIGLIENVLRLPLVPVIKETEDEIQEAIDALANS